MIPISTITSQLAKPTQDTLKQTLHLLDYQSKQEEAIITYVANDMIFAAHNNANYLSKSKAHSWADSQCFLSSKANIPPNNSVILIIAHIIKHVMAFATKA